MASQEERLLILQMIDDGKISADEGARLLAAIQAPDADGESPSGSDHPSHHESPRGNSRGNSRGDSRADSRGDSSRNRPSRNSRRSNLTSSFNNERSVSSRESWARNMRIRVTDPDTDQDRVDVNVPLKIIEFGLRFVPETSDRRIEDIRDAVNSGEAGTVLDIHDDSNSNRVEISLE